MTARDDFQALITSQLYSQIYNDYIYNYLNAIFHNNKTAMYVYETNYLRANLKITYWMGVYDSNPSLATSTFTPDLGTDTVDPSTAINWPPTAGIFGNVVQSSLATVATSGSYNDLSNKPTIPSGQIQSDWGQTNTSSVDYIKNKPPSRSQSSASRSLNSVFQISSTRDCLVNYSVDIATSLTLTTGQSGTVYLEIASDSGFTTNVQELARFTNGNTGTLTIGLALSQNVTGGLNGYVPIAYYSRLRTANNTGTPTFTYRSGQEVLL